MLKRLLLSLACWCTIFHGMVYAQLPTFLPSLPELSFTAVQDKSKFLGDRWSYMEMGDTTAPSIIAMHGYGGSSNDWRFQLHALSKHYRVIAWNAPGYMLTDELKTQYPTAKDYADALADFLASLRLDKVYLMGNSFGTRVSQAFAYYYPERVIKIAMVGPSAGKKKLSYEERANYINMRYSQIKDGGYAFSARRADALVAPNPTPALLNLVQSGMKGVNPSMFMKGVHFMLAEDHYPELMAQKITMPVLIIAGEYDKVSPVETNAKPIAQHFKSNTLHILKNIGHLPHIEAPETVNKLVLDFFGIPKPNSTSKPLTAYQLSVKKHIDSLIQYQEQITLKQDTAAMRQFYPDDMVITNPFGQLINKEQMLERVKSGIIQYESCEKVIEHFSMEGNNVAFVEGYENVKPGKNANRADAGKAHNRRFTEVWVLRFGKWQRLIRHGSNMPL